MPKFKPNPAHNWEMNRDDARAFHKQFGPTVADSVFLYYADGAVEEHNACWLREPYEPPDDPRNCRETLRNIRRYWQLRLKRAELKVMELDQRQRGSERYGKHTAPTEEEKAAAVADLETCKASLKRAEEALNPVAV